MAAIVQNVTPISQPIQKFGRNYYLSVGINKKDPTDVIIIRPPYSLEFDITRNLLSSSNIGKLRIYNLDAAHRQQIRYDFSNFSSNFKISLRAGYGTSTTNGLNLPLIFTGNITQAYSEREAVNWVTTIESFDAGFDFINAQLPGTLNFPSGTAYGDILQQLVGYLPNTTPGAIGNYYKKDAFGNLIVTTRARSLNGSVTENIKTLAPNAFFIDNGKVFVLSTNECRQGAVAFINSQSGLIGTPLREQGTVTFSMIFEPGIILGQIIQLQSLTAPQFNSNEININPATLSNVNGYYKIVSIKHRALISPTVCGDAITTLQFFYGPNTAPLVVSTQ